MKKEMLINVTQQEECRIAIVEDGQLEELYVERASQESYVGNIYKGKVVNIEPSIQAVFIDFGIGRNGFLHVSDVDPAYYKHMLPREVIEEMESMERDDSGRPAGGPPRNRDRVDRGERSDRGDRGERRERRPMEPRPQSTFTPSAPAAPQIDIPSVGYTDDETLIDFGMGIDENAPPPVWREAVSVVNSDEALPESPPPILQHILLPEPPPPQKFTTDEDLAGFGEGLDFDGFAPRLAPVEPEVELESDVVVELTDANDDDAPKRGRPRKVKAKGEEEDDKPKKARRGKKKADDEEGDDKPKTMPSAERRTTGDDEPEIMPFFSDDSGFDPNAPNDRFASGDDGDSDGEDTAEPEETEGESEEGDDSEPVEALENVEPTEEFEPRSESESRGGGDRGGRGGDRGGRGGDRGGRGGDRGGRGRSDRGDRGGRGGDRGGDRGGSRGPSRGGMGSKPMSKSHTRHKGLPIPPIQEIFKRGQEVIVQVIKEGIGTKGPTLSTFISIAGRYLVLMPSLNRMGVSKKIEDRDARHRLRDIMDRLNPPKGVGFIVRTAAVDRDEKELQTDLAYLLRLWQVVARRIKRVAAPVEIYRESDMITRTIRDIFTNDIDTIWVDEEKAFAHASEFLQIVMPKFASRIRYHGETEPLFTRYRIEDEIAKINHKRLDLQGGGSIIIEQTEALVAIDVNSGNFRADNNAEETAFQMNQRAAKEIARQLRLRDLGGVIVNDFIDMREEWHRREVENTLRNALKRDRARTKILRISEFGIIEMTRQRMQPSLKKRVYSDCPHCAGTGYVKTQETMGIEVIRLLQLAAHRCPGGSTVTVSVHIDVAFYLLNKKRKEITAIEQQCSMEIQVDGKPGVSPDLCEFKCIDTNGMEVRMLAPVPLKGGRFGPAPRPLNG